jgi:endoglucanase
MRGVSRLLRVLASLSAGVALACGCGAGGVRAGAGGTDAAAGDSDGAPVPGPPRLHTEGRWFVDPAENVVVLRGVAVADLHDVDTMRAPYDVAKLMDLVSDASQGWDARILRLVVFPAIWKGDPAGYLKTHLEPAVAHAAALGLYVIIDWHEIADAASVDGETRAFWTQVAPLFAKNTNVLYEVFNEAEDFADPSWATWKINAQPWVDLIRQAAPDTIVLIGAPEYTQAVGGAATDPFIGENLAYVGHIYATVDPSLWSDVGAFTQVAATRPMMITEWGYSAESLGGGDEATFGDPLKQYIEAHRLSWTAWCADTVWEPAMFDASWNLRVGPTEMGGFAKDWLAEKKDSDQPGGTGGPPTGGGGTDAGSGSDDATAGCGGPAQPCCSGQTCGADLVCDGADDGGTCIVEFTSCDLSTPCPAGSEEECIADGICAIVCPDGGACPLGQECASTLLYCEDAGCMGTYEMVCMAPL